MQRIVYDVTPVTITRAPDSFKEPADYDEHDRRRNELCAEVDRLSTAISNRDARDESGRRMDSRQYWQWRQAAVTKLDALRRELRFLKDWRKRVHDEKPGRNKSEWALIAEAAAVLEWVAEQGIKLPPMAAAVIDGANHRCTAEVLDRAASELDAQLADL